MFMQTPFLLNCFVKYRPLRLRSNKAEDEHLLEHPIVTFLTRLTMMTHLVQARSDAHDLRGVGIKLVKHILVVGKFPNIVTIMDRP